ncbi:MAG: hypothetical protein AAB225_15455, partial [Acidobacteriota bacterium]
MNRWRQGRSLGLWFRIAAVFGGLVSAVPGFAQAYAPRPVRLALKAVRATVPVGTRGRLIVLFLDRRYQPAASDARRFIQLRQELTEPAGAVELPPGIEAMPGQGELPVEFMAVKPGRVLIRAESKGLEPGSVLLMVTRSKAAGPSLLRQVWAQAGPKLEIVTQAAAPAPANGTSRIGFFVTLDRSSPSETEVRIDSQPPCVLLYEGRNTRPATGALVITIPPEEQMSLEVQARAYQAGPVSISARALPDGPPATATLTFEEPQPR